jgi:hypothetical protein
MLTICVFLKCFLRYLLSDPDLSLARSFSLRNGFGCIPRPTFNDRDYELYTLLTSLTMAEEGAIHTITPLISITRLLHGNIGTKGNTSCVWQSNTRLIQLLPNLPSEVGAIFLSFRRRGGNANGNPELTSHGFKRCNIARALYLLQRTGLDPWIFFLPQRLQEWPVSCCRGAQVTRRRANYGSA